MPWHSRWRRKLPTQPISLRRICMIRAGRAAGGVRVDRDGPALRRWIWPPEKLSPRDLSWWLTDVYYSRLSLLLCVASYKVPVPYIRRRLPHGELEQGDVDWPLDSRPGNSNLSKRRQNSQLWLRCEQPQEKSSNRR